jgi:hypothetical protein
MVGHVSPLSRGRRWCGACRSFKASCEDKAAKLAERSIGAGASREERARVPSTCAALESMATTIAPFATGGGRPKGRAQHPQDRMCL